MNWEAFFCREAEPALHGMEKGLIVVHSGPQWTPQWGVDFDHFCLLICFVTKFGYTLIHFGKIEMFVQLWQAMIESFITCKCVDRWLEKEILCLPLQRVVRLCNNVLVNHFISQFCPLYQQLGHKLLHLCWLYCHKVYFYFYRTQVNLGSDSWAPMSVSKSNTCVDLTDMTLADEDTK